MLHFLSELLQRSHTWNGCCHYALVNLANADLLHSYMYHGKGVWLWVMNHVRSHKICISICHTLPQVTRARQRCLSL